MSEIEGFSTYEKKKINDYINQNLKVSAWWKVDAPDISIGGTTTGKTFSIKLGFTAFIRSLTIGKRYKFAMFKWLLYETTLQDLVKIQSESGLNHIPESLFISNLISYCNESLIKHPNLTKWIHRKNILLEFKLDGSMTLPKELRSAQRLHRNLLMQAYLKVQSNPKEAYELSKNLITQTLEAASRTVQYILAKNPDDECGFRANLMIPVDSNQRNFYANGNEVEEKNNQSAEDLWSSISSQDYDKCLLIVEETKQAHHTGFWVPLIKGSRNLPGASEAYCRKKTISVFKDDLPPIEGFSEPVSTEWVRYMKNNFEEFMFVSIPFGMRMTPQGETTIVAVLNVNGDPPKEDGWRKAYHKEWLKIAQEEATPFIEIAFYALLIKMYYENSSYPALNTEVNNLNSLYEMSEHTLLLPGSP